MRIQNMFQEDIYRKINGVVKVDQDASDVLVQELKEYVILGASGHRRGKDFKHFRVEREQADTKGT